MDKFTVDRANGNGDLTYLIGMLTADEAVFAGNLVDSNRTTTYLSMYSNDYHRYWTLSPHSFGLYTINNYNFDGGGIIPGGTYFDTRGIRPSVSLNNKTYITGGNGSFATPYRVD